MVLSVVKPHFSKAVDEIPAFYISVEKSVTYNGMFRKVALLENSRKWLLTELEAYNIQISVLLKTKIWTILENIQEKFCNGVPFQTY